MILNPSIWIFGYGSLTWKPCINYAKREIGFIWGFSRKFWQGNIHQRGTFEKPGRVATLISSEGEKCWGVAYEVRGEENIENALSHLESRETKLGGYRKFITKFYGRDAKDPIGEEETFADVIDVLCFTATPSNPHYLGPCDVELMADQIVGTSGSCGPNSEYITRLAQFLLEHIPEDNDTFLFTLDAKIKEKLGKNKPRQLFSSLIGQNLQDSLNKSIKKKS